MTRHAVLRAGERYRVLIGEADEADLDALIARRDPRAVFLFPRKARWWKRAQVFAVPHRGRWLAACWCEGQIITFFPPCVLEPYVGLLWLRGSTLHGEKP